MRYGFFAHICTLMNVSHLQNNTLVSTDNKGMAAYLYECAIRFGSFLCPYNSLSSV